MSGYEPNSRRLRRVLIFCFDMKKPAAKTYPMLSNTYGEIAISERTCRDWLQHFKKDDFDIDGDRHGDGRDKVLTDTEWETLLHEVS
ncbi:hypothetical protein Trydic_g2198 [Trypoxylus dichotomus]